MKSARFAPWFALATAIIAWPACKAKNQADASQPLTQSFQAAEPATRQAIHAVTEHLNAGNYTEAARSLAPIVNQPNLSAAQKQAIAIALGQLNQAIAKNPALDTKEMYELRQRMFRAVDGGPRF